MSDRKWYLSIEHAIDELRDLVRCRCHPGFKDRGLHDPSCDCDSAEAVEVLVSALPAVQPDAREAALREAASYHEFLADDEDALSAKYRGGSNPWFAHVQRASWHREHASAILALKGEIHD